jgi:hypothetical protein
MVLLVAGCAVPAAAPPSEVAAVGQIEAIDVAEGYIIAVFPNGRMTVWVDKRELPRYLASREIAIDSFGRPVYR